MKYKGVNLEKETIWAVANMMAAAATTAPKGCGINNVEIIIIDDIDKEQLVEKMKELGRINGLDFFISDAECIGFSPYVVLIGVKNKPVGMRNCGYCGFENCEAASLAGANCTFNISDLGIALGSAVSTAANHKIDNRIMFSAGKAAIELGMFSRRVSVGFGIPLSVTGKSIYYDRDITL